MPTAPPPLHDYQKTAVEFLQRPGGSGLFLDMGLGKTAASLTALRPDMLPALVTAPKRVAEETWPAEVPKWRPDLTIAVAAGKPAQRAAALQSGADVVVIGRDNLADAVPHAKRFRTFILDELSGFKTKSSARWKAAKKIADDVGVSRVWGLTGTPEPNGAMDLWAQVYLLDGGVALGKTLTGFRNRYFSPGQQLPSGTITRWDIRPGAHDSIMRKLEGFCLSMQTDGRLQLPEVTYNVVDVPLPPEARKLYQTMKRDMVAGLELLGEVHSASTAAVLSQKLEQIASGFLYKDDADLRAGAFSPVHNEKTNALREIIDGSSGGVLVGYRYKAELGRLKGSLGSIAHTLDEPNIVERWNAGEVPVLLAHPASAGHGLNLQFGGHTIVWATVPWSLEEYMQFNKRLPRQGQKHPVVIHHLVAQHTVDQAKMERLQEKKSMQQALLDHLESPL